MKLKSTLSTLLITAAIAMNCNISNKRGVSEYCSSSNKYDSSTNFLPRLYSYDGDFKPFIAESFDEGTGATLFASKDKGLEELIKKAKNDSIESSWIYFPEFTLWVHDLVSVGDAKGMGSSDFMEYMLSFTSGFEMWHTHTDKEHENIYSQEVIDDYLHALFIIPSRDDVHACLQNNNNNLEKNIKVGIASSKGSFLMYSETEFFDYDKPQSIYTVNAIADMFDREYEHLREYFKGVPLDSLEQKAKEYDSYLKIEFKLNN